MAECRAFCRREGLEVAAELTEAGYSGGLDLAERPVLCDALVQVAELGEGAALVFWDWSRLARSVLATELALLQLKRTGGRALAANGTANEDTPESELMRRVLGAFDSYDRAKIALRTRVALRAKRARGERLGPRPFGRDARELDVLTQARQLTAAGLSPQQVAAELTGRGHAGRNGAAITATAVRRWLKGRD